MRYQRFEDLPVWQAARILTNVVYNVTRNVRFNSDPGLRAEMRENARSVMNNISEGFERGSNAEFVQFLRYAKGSAGELRSGSYVALDQKTLPSDDHQRLHDECENVARQLSGFMDFLRRSDFRGSRVRRDDPPSPPPASR